MKYDQQHQTGRTLPVGKYKIEELECEIRLFERNEMELVPPSARFFRIDFLIYRVISCSSPAYSILFVISDSGALRNAYNPGIIPHFAEHSDSHPFVTFCPVFRLRREFLDCSNVMFFSLFLS